MLDDYSEYKAEIGSLVEKGIVAVLDGCLVWLPTLLDEMKEAI